MQSPPGKSYTTANAVEGSACFGRSTITTATSADGRRSRWPTSSVHTSSAAANGDTTDVCPCSTSGSSSASPRTSDSSTPTSPRTSAPSADIRTSCSTKVFEAPLTSADLDEILADAVGGDASHIPETVAQEQQPMAMAATARHKQPFGLQYTEPCSAQPDERQTLARMTELMSEADDEGADQTGLQTSAPSSRRGRNSESPEANRRAYERAIAEVNREAAAATLRSTFAGASPQLAQQLSKTKYQRSKRIRI
jgi:hypothetical protein